MQERQVSIDGDDAPARAAVPRPRDAEPDRVRGHLPAPGGAARPLRAAHGLRLSVGGRRVGDAGAAARARRATRWSYAQVVDRPTLLEMQRAVEGVHVDESVGRYVVELVGGDAGEPQRLGRLEPTRLAGAPEALALPRRARRPGLRDARRRQERRRACARPPPRAPARALGAAADAARTSCASSSTRCRRRRPRAPTHSPRDGVTRSADARLGAYAALAAAGLVAALGAPARRARRRRRAVRAPRRRSASARRAPELRAWFDLDRERALEGDELDATLTVRSPTGVDRLEVGLVLPPGSSSPRAGTRWRCASHPARSASCRCACAAGAGRPVEVGDIRLRARDRIGLVRSRGPRSTGAARSRSTPRPSGSARSSPPRTRRRRREARSPASAPRASSSPTRGRSCPATSSARSTGARPRAAAASSSTSDIPSATPTSCVFLDSFAEARECGRGHARARRPVAATLGDRLPRAARPRRARHVRRRPALARARQRARPARTGSSTRCSRPASSSATRGRTST